MPDMKNLRRADVLPVQGNTEEAETFVTVRAAEEVRDDILGRLRGMLSRQTDDADTVQERENVGGEHLEAEHAGKCRPEELQPLSVAFRVEMES